MKKKRLKAEPSSAASGRRRRWEGAAPIKPGVGRSALAFTIREIYVRERSAAEQLLYGGEFRYRPPHSYDGSFRPTQGMVAEDSVWHKMMLFYAAQKIDPHAFMGYMFGRCEPGGRLPEPNMLYGPKSIAKWERAQEEKGREIETILTVQTQIAKNQIGYLQRICERKVHDSYAMVLADTTLALSALFRYCLASSIEGSRFRRIAANYEVDASLQFERYRKYYLRHWKDFLPNGFAKRSGKVYAMLYRGTNATKGAKG